LLVWKGKLGDLRTDRKGFVLSLGAFDGFHLGHQLIVRRVVRMARSMGLRSAVLTFEPHPDVFLGKRNGAFVLSTLRERLDLLADHGLDACFVLEFDEELSSTPATAFLEEVLRRLGVVALVLGGDAALGKGGVGGIGVVRSYLRSRGVLGLTVPEVTYRGVKLSSTLVRRFVGKGRLERVVELLGRPYFLDGEVVVGHRIGSSLGFPTANLSFPEEKLLPPVGVYAGAAKLGDALFPAAVNVGFSPTFDKGLKGPEVEAHLLGVEGDLYGRRIRLFFLRRLRDERRFSSPSELARQMEEDVRLARASFDREEGLLIRASGVSPRRTG